MGLFVAQTQASPEPSVVKFNRLLNSILTANCSSDNVLGSAMWLKTFSFEFNSTYGFYFFHFVLCFFSALFCFVPRQGLMLSKLISNSLCGPDWP